MERQLQRQQHEQNQERFKRLEENHEKLLGIQIKQSESLARIEENTKGLSKIIERVDSLEEERGKIKGAIAGVGLLGPTITGLAIKLFKL